MAFFPSLKQDFIAYRSSKVSTRPDCIFEIHQLWQSVFSRVYSNCCCSCSFELEIIKIDQSSHKMYNNNILNFQESRTILNACAKKSGKLLNSPRSNEGILHIPLSCSITGASPSDCLVSYQDTRWGISYHYAEVQSVYSTAPADWAALMG